MANLKNTLLQTQFLRSFIHGTDQEIKFFSRGEIQNKLKKMGLSYNQICFSALATGTFDKLEEIFSKTEGIYCYVTNEKSNILFIKDEEKFEPDNININLSLALDLSLSFEGLKKILDFMNKNNISNITKVSKNISTSNVNICLNNMEDVKLVSDFISCDKLVQATLNEPNPFSFSHNKISYSFDFGLENYTYEIVLCSYIAHYLSEKTYTEQETPVCASDFNTFLAKNLQILRNSCFSRYRFEKMFGYLFDEDFDLNKLIQMTELIYKSCQATFDLEKLNSLYDKFKTMGTKSTDDYFEIDKILKCCVFGYDDCSYDEEKVNELEQYLITGNIRKLDITESLKQMMVDADFRNVLNYLLEDNNQTLQEYINEVLTCDLINDRLLKLYKNYGATPEGMVKITERFISHKIIGNTKPVINEKLGIMNKKLGCPKLYSTNEERTFDICKRYTNYIINPRLSSDYAKKLIKAKKED